jgi:ankyrin repeat protein
MRHRCYAVLLAGTLLLTLTAAHAASTSPLADAAERGDKAAVADLLRKQVDVNAAQADGMTALHWSALNGDLNTVTALLAARAKVDPVTRLGDYTPLHLAAERGCGAVVARLLAAGSNAAAVTTTGVQAIHLAADAGSVEAVRALLDKGADVNVKDATHGRTPLIFAASKNRIDAMKLLISRGANVQATTTVVDYVDRSKADGADRAASLRASGPGAGARGGGGGARGAGAGGASGQGRAAGANGAGASANGGGAAAAYDPNADPDPNAVYAQAGRGGRGGGRGPSDIEIIGKQGGLTALHYAARDGYANAVTVLLDAKTGINTRTAGDLSTPLVMAVVNGNYDIAMTLVARGADPNLANDDGLAPLFATLNNEWALRTWYPQPTAGTEQQASYLQLMETLLKAGADPNARTITHVWFAAYNAGRMGVDFAGATPFWRAAYALDIDAMRLLTKYGADPNIPTMSYGSPKRPNDPSGMESVPAGGPHVPPFHAAMGVGYGTSRVAQQHRHVPDGWMPAAKYFVEELKVDINMRDADGFTALHHAAARGDNEMILYLVKHGANVMAVNRAGQTTVDMANSPEQRTQPFPGTIALLEGMGAKNNHKCQACK